MNLPKHSNWQETAQSGPFAGVPQPIVDLCASLADYVERAVGIRPDFTPETLSLVDHYAVSVRSELAVRPELIDLGGQAIGAYFGETVRRNLEGFWRIPSPNLHDWQICGRAAFVAVNPIGIGYDAIAGSTDHAGPSSQFKLAPEDRQAITARLENLPPVPEDEFFSLSTRWEALEVIMEASRGLAESRGYEEMTYDVDDYSAELNPLL